MISDACNLNLISYYFWPIVALVAYWLYAHCYVKKFKNFKYFQCFDKNHKSFRPRGKCPPFFPNGWFRLINSEDLKVKGVKYFDYCGRDIVLFR